ncbi:Protein of unknown function DUF2065 [Bartonella apihabitans]|uniref:DUF2065 domain-containing protein n=1 Tax=Bartonella TaxID=773 RepID=UPI0018DE3822|nr:MULTISPECIES: DUF2065 family protein [Bartonella]MBI0001434.1 DUF2065 family protein [Bartonella sp. W8122]MBI0026249.1 DUF2065 family protein [Bartonella apihabitans]MBI0167146.1 DUF2065 family protein [Bartonella apihabitans]
MELFFTAIGLVLFIEGLVYAGFPALVKKMASQIDVTPEYILRMSGFCAMVIGLIIVWLSHS